MNKQSKNESYKLGQIVYKCDICSDTTINKKEHINHFKENHASRYVVACQCPFCFMYLDSSVILKKHILECLKILRIKYQK